MQPSLIATFSRYHALRDIPIWVTVLVLRFLALLPLPVLHVFSVCLGETLYWAAPSRRRVVMQNLTACYPTHSLAVLKREARGHFKYLCMGVLTTGIGWWAPKKKLEQITTLSNADEFNACLKQGQNVILLAPHFAALEYGGIFLSSQHGMVSMYQKNKNPLLDTLIKEHRSRFGIGQYGSKEPIKGMIKKIRTGAPFYYLPDQDPGRRKGVFAPFFGVQAATFPALGRIAQLSNAVVIPICTRIKPRGRGFEIVFQPAITDYPTGDEAADTSRMNRAVEQLVEVSNCQYFWSHKRFKTRPEGDPPFYS